MRPKSIRAAWLVGPAIAAVTAAACAPMTPPTPPPAPLVNLTNGANGESFGASVSDSGRFVVFTSEASNLVPNDTNNRADVFLADAATGTLKNLTRTGNGDSIGGVISGDGSTVAFYSAATNLTADADNGQFDVFTLNVATNVVTNLTATGDDFSGFPSISDNGSVVSFQSYASNLAGSDSDGGLADIFRASSGSVTQLTSEGDFFDQPVVSGDGATTGFQAYGVSGGSSEAPRVVTVGSVAGPRSDQGSYAGELSLSDNGVTAAFRTFRNPVGVIQVGVNNVSDPTASANDPSLSDSGNRVAYTSGDRVVLTVVGGATSDVAVGNGPTGEPALNGNGLVVAYTSYATNLGVADTNGSVGDIMLRRL